MTGDTLIYCWDREFSRWLKVGLLQWTDFRRVNGDWRPLLGVSDAEFHFAVCVVDRIRTLLNIVPYRYRVDAEGRILSCRFDDLSDEEVERLDLLVMKANLSSEEAHDLRELQERQWIGTLPTAKAAEGLMDELSPFRIGEHSPAIRFLQAFNFDPPISNPSGSGAVRFLRP
jgi:hypothetical protein